MAEFARVKSVVPQSVFRDGKSVLNADNEFTADMARSARGEIIFFSMDENNPVIQDHLRHKGRAVVLRPTRNGDMLTILENKRETSLLLASDIPATFDGRLRVNIANALAAAAAGLADDVQIEYIRQALRTFTTSFYQTPGRFNFMQFDGRRVVMDYCHNLAGLESMGDFVERMDAPRAVGLISMPGDRLDDDIDAFGTLGAKIFDELVVREDTNTRGRQSGEIAARLKAAAVAAGLPEDKVHVVLKESDAVLEAIKQSERDDLVVLMVDKPAESWETLSNLEGAFSIS